MLYHRFAVSMGGRPIDQFVHLPTVLARKRDQHLRTLSGIRNGLRGELLELRVSQQHDVSVFAQDHAGGGLSVNWALNLKPSLPKNSLAFGRSFTGRLTNMLV